MVGHYIHSCYNTWFFHFIVEESSNSGHVCSHTPSNGSPLTSDARCSWEFLDLLPFQLKLSLWTFKIDQQLEFLDSNQLCGCPLKPCSPVISCQVVRCINMLVSAQINHWQIHELLSIMLRCCRWFMNFILWQLVPTATGGKLWNENYWSSFTFHNKFPTWTMHVHCAVVQEWCDFLRACHSISVFCTWYIVVSCTWWNGELSFVLPVALLATRVWIIMIRMLQRSWTSILWSFRTWLSLTVKSRNRGSPL